jgi:hypothetical protein
MNRAPAHALRVDQRIEVSGLPSAIICQQNLVMCSGVFGIMSKYLAQPQRYRNRCRLWISRMSCGVSAGLAECGAMLPLLVAFGPSIAIAAGSSGSIFEKAKLSGSGTLVKMQSV